MKIAMTAFLLLLLTGGSALPQTHGTFPPRTNIERISYSLGVKIAENMKRDGIADINTEFLIRGLEDVFKDTKLALTERTADSLVGMLQYELEAKLKARQRAEGEKNKREGEAFLAANKKKEGVITLPSGLQYTIMRAGSGPVPHIGQKVKCHYRGSFISGKEFQNSYKPHMPIVYTIGGQEIKGWNDALQMMPVGSKWRLYLPPHLAYGEKGAQPIIGGNVTIILDVELLSIEPEATQAGTPGKIEQAAQFVRHLGGHATAFCKKFDTGIYILLFLLICLGTGSLITPFIPADALLFLVGSLAALGGLNIGYTIPLLIAAACAGDNVNYWFGREKVFNTEGSGIFNKEVLIRTHRFYARHGRAGVLLARFIPILRTYVPYHAGAEGMTYRNYLVSSVLGGAVWVSLVLLAGYCVGSIPRVAQNYSIVLLLCLAIYAAPALVGGIGQRARRLISRAVEEK